MIKVKVTNNKLRVKQPAGEQAQSHILSSTDLQDTGKDP